MITAGQGQDRVLNGRRKRPRKHARRAGADVVADALARERRRVAADIHDLIMQDLSLALASARTLADGAIVTSQVGAVIGAGERALAGARCLLEDLNSKDRRRDIDALEASVRMAARHVPLSFDTGGVPAGMQPDQPTLDALVHIGREAVTNAIKHGGPGRIEVALRREPDEWRLQVLDDGRGFDTANASGGLGLESMQEHARALGGSLLITSAPVGTTVEAVLP